MKTADMILIAVAGLAVFFIARQANAQSAFPAPFNAVTSPPRPDPLQVGIAAWYRPTGIVSNAVFNDPAYWGNGDNGYQP